LGGCGGATHKLLVWFLACLNEPRAAYTAVLTSVVPPYRAEFCQLARIQTCRHAYAAHRLLQGPTTLALVNHLLPITRLREADLGLPNTDIFELDSVSPSSPLTISVCFESKVSGRHVFMSDANNAMRCTSCDR
jgi:hypothetical protein